MANLSINPRTSGKTNKVPTKCRSTVIIFILAAYIFVSEFSELLRGQSNLFGGRTIQRDANDDDDKKKKTSNGEPRCLPIGWDQERRTPSTEEKESCLLYAEPSPFVRVLSTVVVGLPREGSCQKTDTSHCDLGNTSPYDKHKRDFGMDHPPFGFTMIGKARLENFRAAILEMERNNIPGAIVELGVWRGGAMAVAAAVTSETPKPRDMYLFDAFEKIPGYGGGLEEFLQTSVVEVKGAFEMFGVMRDNIYFREGLFKDTVPHWDRNTQIAVLRIDANFYDSYQDALYYMYESVPVGGIVIFDDVMSHRSVMQCWKDFKVDQGLPEDLQRIDFHSAWFRKIKTIKIDFNKMHPPEDVNKDS